MTHHSDGSNGKMRNILLEILFAEKEESLMLISTSYRLRCAFYNRLVRKQKQILNISIELSELMHQS